MPRYSYDKRVRVRELAKLRPKLPRKLFTKAVTPVLKKSSEIESILGYPGRAALVHRDDMVL